MNHLGRGRPRPSPLAPATLVVVSEGQSATYTVAPGQRVTIGRDPGESIVLSDPAVSVNHALIERRGPGWLVSSLDAANPAWLLDATGRKQPIYSELGLRSGQLLIGSCQVMLYPPPSDPGPMPPRAVTQPGEPSPSETIEPETPAAD